MNPTALELRAALREDVVDPELGVSVVDLGLIYDLEIQEKRIRVAMTLTSPSCPLAALLPARVKDTLRRRFPHHEVEVRLVWEPQWTPEMMSAEVRRELGIL